MAIDSSEPAVFEERPLVTPFRCRKCLAHCEMRVRRCPACRGTYTVVPLSQTEQKRVRVEVLSSTDATVVDAPRVSTGWPSLDAIFGGGIAVGSTNLIWGEPGIGKTTLLLQLAAAIGFERSLVIQSEQPAAAVMSTVARLGIARRGFDVVVTDDLADTVRVVERGHYQFVVVDSLQMLTDTSLESFAGSIKQGRRVGRTLVRLAHRHNVTMVISNHVLASGRQAGGTFNVHGMDGTFEYSGDLRSTDGVRYVQCLKNRHGGSGRKARLRMGAKGLEEFPETPAETPKEKPRATRPAR